MPTYRCHEYPSFQEITVDGTTEIIEHKAMEPIFYVSDDAALRGSMTYTMQKLSVAASCGSKDKMSARWCARAHS